MKMDFVTYFKDKQEQMPAWLEDYKKGDKINMDKVLSSRVVYYPGAYYDGQPIRSFNKAHAAHTFFYVDYMVSKEEMVKAFKNEDELRGYSLLDIVDISEKQLAPRGWTAHYRPSRDEMEFMNGVVRNGSFCILAIFERKEGYDDSHGAKRIAVIYLHADGIATYDAVFANYARAPYVLALQDHGFGGNYNRFGKGGAMEMIARQTHTYPSFITCQWEGDVWDGYDKIEDVTPEIGGMHRNIRHLFKRP